MTYKEFLSLNRKRKKGRTFPAAKILDINKNTNTIIISVDTLGASSESLQILTIPDLVNSVSIGNIAYLYNCSKLNNWNGWN